MACPNCDAVNKQRADTEKTVCLKCGESYNSGLQRLAQRLI